MALNASTASMRRRDHVGSLPTWSCSGAITEPYGSLGLFACLVDAIWAEAIQIALVTLAGGTKELSS